MTAELDGTRHEIELLQRAWRESEEVSAPATEDCRSQSYWVQARETDIARGMVREEEAQKVVVSIWCHLLIVWAGERRG